MFQKMFLRLCTGVLLVLLTPAALPVGASLARQAGTPAPTSSCDTATPVAATPAMVMAMGTPMAGMEMTVEFDQLYIDMMLPHHASIVALAEAALPRLEDDRLREIAQAIITAQEAEIEELRGYREAFYGSPEPGPMDDHMMGMMMQAMPGMPGTMAEMAVQMDPQAQVAALCAAPDPDRAFIETTIAHHEMAIAASAPALEQAIHPEIADFAQRVIAVQQAEIAALTEIRQELYG